jgi:type IV pilus secretin PilQ/predicted competence protein
MKRDKALWATSFICIVVLFSGFMQSSDPYAVVDQIFVHQGVMSTKVVLQATSPPPLFTSHYTEEDPITLVVDLGGVTVNANQPFSVAENSVIENIELEEKDPEQALLLLRLKEKLPYRLYSYENTTIIEFNQYQNNRNPDYIPAAIERKLENGLWEMSSLKNIDITEKNDKIEIKAKLSGETQVDIFALENPYRLVADLYNTKHGLSKSSYTIARAGIKTMRTAQFRAEDPCPITRLVFDLNEPRQYGFSTENGNILVTFSNMSVKQVTEPNDEPSTALEEKPNNGENGLRENSAEQKETEQAEQSNGEEEAKITSPPETPPIRDEQSPPVDQQTESDEVSNGETNPSFTQTIGAQPEKYIGDVVSMRFKDADLRDVVLYLGELANVNVVFDPAVAGEVTCNFVDVPWDQALNVILINNRMGKVLEGNILRVAPVEVLSREKEAVQRIQESIESTDPLVIRTFPLSYAEAEDVQLLLTKKMSDRGEILVDPRTNTLVITDIQDRIDIIEELITTFDKPTPQVTIEARIVEASSTFIRNLGVQWGWRGIADPFYGNQTSLQFPNKINLDGAMIPQGMVTKGVGGPLGGYGINLPAPAFSTAVGLSLANVLDTFGLDMALTALETSGTGKIISRPTVTTQNNIQAEIVQGSQIPVQTVANFTTTVTFVNAALELRATPQITEEGTIIMYIDIKNNAPDFGNLVNGIPPINMQSATTTVMVPDGGTTVIGGIYHTENSVTKDRVPFFYKIPILGNLFRATARTEKSKELLIFITPRINKN